MDCPTMTIRMRRAVVEQLPVVISLTDEAVDWLRRAKDTDQWSRPWPSPELSRERLRRFMKAGATWIGWDGGIPAATITTESRADPRLWTRRERAEPAVYVHRLVVSRGYAGYGLGAALLDWAARRAARSYGARWVRVDVWTTNKELHAYYQGQGFTLVRIREDPAYPSGALFQRPTTRASCGTAIELATG